MTASGARRNPCKADQFNWTEDRVALVTELWGDGLSGSLIADKLGVSRNTVLGKIHRLGLGRLRGAVSGQTVTSKPRGYRSHQRPRQARQDHIGGATKLVPELPDEAVPAVTLMELQHHHCRWPLGEPTADMMYCGAQKWAGAYCAQHCRMAYRLPERRAA